MSNKPLARRTVADIILEKLTEKKTEIETQMTEDSRTLAGGNGDDQLDDRVVRMYTQIKHVLHKYRSGKLPKAFKILPSLNNWEHVSSIQFCKFYSTLFTKPRANGSFIYWNSRTSFGCLLLSLYYYLKTNKLYFSPFPNKKRKKKVMRVNIISQFISF